MHKHHDSVCTYRQPQEQEVLDLPQQAHEGRVEVDAEEVRRVLGPEEEGQGERGLFCCGW